MSEISNDRTPRDTRNDAVFIRMMAGACFGPDATVTLPSGKTITGAEMQRWIEANASPA